METHEQCRRGDGRTPKTPPPATSTPRRPALTRILVPHLPNALNMGGPASAGLRYAGVGGCCPGWVVSGKGSACRVVGIGPVVGLLVRLGPVGARGLVRF